MTTNELISKGYFTEELPPPFHTPSLAIHHSALLSYAASLSAKDKEKLKETSPVLYSTPKIGIYRRMAELPNPFHQIPLADVISLNWADIKKHWKQSDLPVSTPTLKKTKNVQLSKFPSFRILKKNV